VAVAHCADAVYLGADIFSARANAENFNEKNIKDAIDYAHLFGVKVYVTVNTLIKNKEMNKAIDLIKMLEKYNADAVIIQDLGLIQKVRKESNIILHGSTQMGIHNLDGALIARDLGLSRVVVSRETSIKDIEKISSAGIETEVFVQGALCVAFSGNCYFSSIVSGYSGNRGKCLQLCRKLYQSNKGTDYRLSTSDMCLANDLKRLKDAGVCSLKIEGRMRRPEYVAAAVDLYKNALKNEPIQKNIAAVKTMYNRGDYNRSYYFEPTANVIYPLTQNHIGISIGKVKNATAKTFTSSTMLKAGNGYKLLRQGRECGGGLAIKDSYESGYTGSAKVGDEIRLTTDKALGNALLSQKRKIEATAQINFTKENTLLKLKASGVEVDVKCEAMPIAQNAPADFETISKQLKKSGDSDFEITDIDVQQEYDVFLIKGRINELRRQGLNELKAAIIKNYNKNITRYFGEFNDLTKYVSPLEINGIVAVVESHIIPQNIHKNCEYIIINPKEYSMDYLSKFNDDKKYILNLPIIAREEEIDIIKEIINSGLFDKFVVNNLYALNLCKGKKVLLGANLNMINSECKLPKINSIENDCEQQFAIPYIYAHPALMTFCHCPKKSMGGNCKDCKGYSITLTDEKNETFDLRRYKIKYCYSQLIPTKPLYYGAKNCGIIDLTGVNEKEYESIFNDIVSNKIPLNTANFNKGLK